MEDIGAAELLAERFLVGADVDDDRVGGLGQVGDGDEIVRLEIGDDEGVALGEDLLGLRHHVGVRGDDGFDQLEGEADERARLVGFLDDEARALDAFVGDDLLGIGERQRLLIFLAEIDDGHRRLDRHEARRRIGSRGRRRGGRSRGRRLRGSGSRGVGGGSGRRRRGGASGRRCRRLGQRGDEHHAGEQAQTKDHASETLKARTQTTEGHTRHRRTLCSYVADGGWGARRHWGVCGPGHSARLFFRQAMTWQCAVHNMASACET